MIEIVAQPSNRQALIDTNTTFTVDASLTDSSYTTELSYQWALQGEDIDDGTVTTTTSATNVDITYTSDDAIDLPSDATDVVITVAGGKGGDGGSDAGGSGGSGGNGRGCEVYLS